MYLILHFPILDIIPTLSQTQGVIQLVLVE